MFLATVAAALFMTAAPIDDKPVKCAVMGSPTTATSKAAEYAGARYPFCCGGCDGQFMKEPAKFVTQAAKAEGVVGVFLFCPVSGERLDIGKAKASIDYKGIRYGFCCNDCEKAFKADPAKYTKVPAKESLVCAVSGEKINSYSASAGYVDFKGVRYYTCCDHCLPTLKKDTAKVIAGGKAKATAPAAMTATNSQPEKHDGG